MLHAGTVVTGSIQLVGDRLRVSVELFDAATGSAPDTTTVERPSGDLFALEDDVGDQVARFLRQRLGRQLRIRRLQAETRSVSAWRLYHEAEEVRAGTRQIQPYADSASSGAASALLYRADSLFAQAEAADHRWVAPIVERGWVAIQQAELRPRDTAWYPRWLSVGSTHADRAAARAPHDARVLELAGDLAYLQGLHQRDPAAAQREYAVAERYLRGAAQADSTRAGALGTLSRVLSLQGRVAEAAVVARRALEKDAYLADAPLLVYRVYMREFELGQLQSADDWCARGQREFPTHPYFPQCRLQLMAVGGIGPPDPNRAWLLLEEADRLVALGRTEEAEASWVVFRRAMVAGVLARAGLRDSASAVLQRLQLYASSDQALLATAFAINAAQVETLLRDRDSALYWLGVYLRAVPTSRDMIRRIFIFRDLHSDARFDALVGSDT